MTKTSSSKGIILYDLLMKKLRVKNSGWSEPKKHWHPVGPDLTRFTTYRPYIKEKILSHSIFTLWDLQFFFHRNFRILSLLHFKNGVFDKNFLCNHRRFLAKMIVLSVGLPYFTGNFAYFGCITRNSLWLTDRFG